MSKTPEESTIKGKVRENLLELLKETQNNFGYLPENSIIKLAKSLNISVSEVYGLATFYSFISTRPLGRNVIRVCKSLPCFLKNSEVIIQSIEKELGIHPGETTSDGKFSMQLTNCIGACDQAPAMMINYDVYTDLTPEKVSGILRTYE